MRIRGKNARVSGEKVKKKKKTSSYATNIVIPTYTVSLSKKKKIYLFFETREMTSIIIIYTKRTVQYNI